MSGKLVKDGIPIRDLEDWKVRAGPKHSMQWKDGRSAKESAKSWLGSDGIPAELLDLIYSHHDFGTIEQWMAEPEARVRFDDFRGEPPNIDVLIYAEDRFGPLVVVVEAKADEPFGATIRETMTNARGRLAESPKSKGLVRLERLSHALAGKSPDEPKIASLRYQLFTATGAALAEADRRGAERAVVLVHEFVSEVTAAEKRRYNQNDLKAFIAMLSPDMRARDGLAGPICVPGAPLTTKAAKLYFGKATSDVSSNGV